MYNHGLQEVRRMLPTYVGIIMQLYFKHTDKYLYLRNKKYLRKESLKNCSFVNLTQDASWIFFRTKFQ